MINICRFCQKEKIKILPSLYRCVPCGMTSLYNLNTLDLVDEIYVRYINDIEYHLIIGYSQEKCKLYAYHPNTKHKYIIDIDHTIVTTPDTIVNKIKTYLLFL